MRFGLGGLFTAAALGLVGRSVPACLFAAGGSVGGIAFARSGLASLALGLGVELDLPVFPVGIRANLDYATGSDLQATVDDRELEAIETTLLAVVADLVFRPLPRISPLQPYLFAGGGLKQYDVTEENVESFEEESDPTLHVGGGIGVRLGGFELNAEVGDYISWYELQEGADTEVQHDIFASIGFSIGIL